MVVAEYVQRLLDAGLGQDQIGILTPYSAQVGLLRQLLKTEYPDVEIGTVDGFQGREKEAILLSLVRSNTQRQVGFLADDRRLNVAVTRARRHVCIICDSETVSNHKFIAALLAHCHERDAPVLCAHELVPPDSYSAGALSASEGRRRGPARGEGGGKGGKRGQGRGSKGAGSGGQARGAREETEEQKVERAGIEARIEGFVEAASRGRSGDGGAEAQGGRQGGLSGDAQAQPTLRFEACVSPFGRRVVHELAEKLGLRHESVGEGDARYISVSFPQPASSAGVQQQQQQHMSTEAGEGAGEGATSREQAEQGPEPAPLTEHRKAGRKQGAAPVESLGHAELVEEEIAAVSMEDKMAGDGLVVSAGEARGRGVEGWEQAGKAEEGSICVVVSFDKIGHEVMMAPLETVAHLKARLEGCVARTHVKVRARTLECVRAR